MRPSRRSVLVGLSVIGFVMSMLAGNLTFVSAASNTTGPVLTTSPVSTVINTKPGGTATTQLQVQNNGQKAVNLAIKVEKFKADGDTGQPQILPFTSQDDAQNWVSFSRTSLVAEPGVWNQITMTVSPPTSAALGYYYAVIFAPTTSQTSVDGNYNVKGANAILVLADAKVPNEKVQLQVTKFTVGKKSYQYLPAELNVTAKNIGNIYSAPQGEVFISRTPHGTPLASLTLNSGQGNVLPGTSRTFSVTWDDGFPSYQKVHASGQVLTDKNGKPVQKLSWDLNRVSKFRFGRYYARLVLVYNNGVQDIPMNAVVSFWVIPWFLIIASLIVVIIAGIGVWTLGKGLFKRVKKLR